MRFNPNTDLEIAVDVAHRFVGNIAYQLNRRNGLLDRINAAIGDGVRVADESLMAFRLAADARTLRALADSLDGYRDELTDRAPRLRLIAAE